MKGSDDEITRCLFIALTMEAASTSETSANSYQSTRRSNPDDSHLQETPNIFLRTVCGHGRNSDETCLQTVCQHCVPTVFVDVYEAYTQQNPICFFLQWTKKNMYA
jgi:hypothetical protein